MYPYKACVKFGVVCNNNTSLTKIKKSWQNLGKQRLVFNHIVGNSRKLGYLFGNMPFGVYKLCKGVHHLAVHQLYRADFGYSFALRVKSCCFYIKNHIHIIDITARYAVYVKRQIVYKIAFRSVKYLELLSALFDFSRSGIRLRECLCNAVIGYRDSSVSPLCGTVYQIRCGGNRVLCAHFGVHMQLNALFLRIIHTYRRLFVQSY